MRNRFPRNCRIQLGSLENVVLLTGDRKFESISLQQTVCLSPAVVFEGREPGFSARVWAAGLTTRSAETRRCFDIAPDASNISVGPYSGTAVSLIWAARMPRRPEPNQAFSGLACVDLLNSDRAQPKPSTRR